MEICGETKDLNCAALHRQLWRLQISVIFSLPGASSFGHVKMLTP